MSGFSWALLQWKIESERIAVAKGLPSVIEQCDATWEDPQGRMWWDEGYGTGGEVVELPIVEPPEPMVVVGDYRDVLRRMAGD